jgi:hypothetical protein
LGNRTPELIEHLVQIIGKWRLELDPLPGVGVAKDQTMGVEENSRSHDSGTGSPIDRVPEHRMFDRRHVNPYLVGPTRVQIDVQQSEILVGVVPDQAIVRDSRLSTGEDGPACGMCRIAADGSFDGPGLDVHRASDQCEIRAGDLPPRQGAGQRLECTLIPADEQEPGRIAIETMDQAPTVGRTHSLQLGITKQQPGGQGPFRMTGARMNDHPSRLVDHDEVRILVDDAESHVLGLETTCHERLGRVDQRPGTDPLGSRGGHTVELDPTLDEGSRLRPGHTEQHREDLVHPLPVQLLRDLQNHG